MTCPRCFTPDPTREFYGPCALCRSNLQRRSEERAAIRSFALFYKILTKVDE